MNKNTAEVKIKIDGKPLKDYTFSEIRLVQEMRKPNELCFLMHKKVQGESYDEVRFSLSQSLLGKTVDYNLSVQRLDAKGNHRKDTLSFSGIIFNVSAQRRDIKAGLSVKVMAYSPDYLLYDNPHCYSYEDQTLKNIVNETIKPYKIPVQFNPRLAETVIPYTVQYNESNHDFISRLAARFGEWFYYNGSELVFGKIEKTDVKEVHLLYDILHYQYELDMEHPDFIHAHHDYMQDYNTAKGGLSYSGMNIHNMADITYQSSKKLYSKKNFRNLERSAPKELDFSEVELSVKAQGLGQKARMMVCSVKKRE